MTQDSETPPMASDSPTPTLLELLAGLAVHHQERATSPDEDGMSKWIHGDLAQQARAAHARLREEMGRQRAEVDARDACAPRVLYALRRINNGPLEPTP